MIGLETALAVALTELGGAGPEDRPGDATLPIADILGLLSWRPAQIAGLSAEHGGPIATGASANLCVIDPRATWVVDPARMASRSRNSPFAGRSLSGRVRHTVYRGDPVVIDGEAKR
jgi:dihydroorotase